MSTGGHCVASVGQSVGEVGHCVRTCGHSVLTGEVAEFRPQEKLGDLELYFLEDRSLKIEIGSDLFLIIVGKKYCAFRSRSLRRQVNSILETRKAKSGGKSTSRSGGSRPSR